MDLSIITLWQKQPGVNMQAQSSFAFQLAPEFSKRFESKCLQTPLIKKLDDRIATLQTGIAYDKKEIADGQESVDRLNRSLTDITHKSKEQITEIINKRTDIREWIEARKKHLKESKGELHEVEATRKRELNFLNNDSAAVRSETETLKTYQQVELPAKQDAVRKKIEFEDHVATVIFLREQLFKLNQENDQLDCQIKLRQRYLKYLEKRTRAIEILQVENILDLVKKGSKVELISIKVNTRNSILKINLNAGNCNIRIATLGEREIRCVEKGLACMRVYELKLYAIAEQIPETVSDEIVMQRLEVDLKTYPQWQTQVDTVSVTLKDDSGVVTMR